MATSRMQILVSISGLGVQIRDEGVVLFPNGHIQEVDLLMRVFMGELDGPMEGIDAVKEGKKTVFVTCPNEEDIINVTLHLPFQSVSLFILLSFNKLCQPPRIGYTRVFHPYCCSLDHFRLSELILSTCQSCVIQYMSHYMCSPLKKMVLPSKRQATAQF